MLQKAHELLTQADIPYWICGGALIGAIRHEGLIPHDDDIDLDDFFGDDSEEDEVKKKMVDDDSSLVVVPAASSQDYRSVTCLGNSKKLILMKFNTLFCSWMETALFSTLMEIVHV